MSAPVAKRCRSVPGQLTSTAKIHGSTLDFREGQRFCREHVAASLANARRPLCNGLTRSDDRTRRRSREGHMTDSGSLQDSLAAMGFIELGLALLTLCCYALAF